MSLVVPTSQVFAHEFWIEPHIYQLDNGGTLEADFKNGQEFKGNSLSFFDRNSTLFELATPNQRITLTPRLGDNPALKVAAPARDALVTVLHETAPSTLTYSKWEKFLKFVDHKDFKHAVRDHEAAGWSKVRFKEIYTRHVKSLVAVGSGNGADKAYGLKTEFVALTNPYEPDFNNNMKVALYFDGELRPDAQVEVFDRAADGNVAVTLHRTDKAGEALIAVQPGHDYLFDAVVLQSNPDASTEEGATVWKTYWAALTFAVPQ